MDEVLSEERQLMKWVGIFQIKIFWVGIFRGEFSRGEFDGWEFSKWEFSRGGFPGTVSPQSHWDLANLNSSSLFNQSDLTNLLQASCLVKS